MIKIQLLTKSRGHFVQLVIQNSVSQCAYNGTTEFYRVGRKNLQICQYCSVVTLLRVCIVLLWFLYGTPYLEFFLILQGAADQISILFSS
jgi:hypothetical protein